MLEIVAGVVALAGLAVSLALAAKVQRLEARLRIAEQSPAPAPALPEPMPERPLERLRIALSIEQDHSHPVFANLLKEQLLTEDVDSIVLLPTGAAPDWNATDILISGKLTCNGYAEIFYETDLTCFSPVEPICTVVQRPPHGDRPVNLAVELVAKLKVELEKLDSRIERRRALRELHE